MKKMYAKGLLVFFTVCVLFWGILYLSAIDPFRGWITRITGSEAYEQQLNASHEVETYIEKARQDDKTTKLIIGDSVCNSLFGELDALNPDYSVLCCNKGITMAGQYILAKEYLANHEGVTDLYLMMISNSLITGFDTDFGYQYAVMPFVKTDKLSYLDEETVEEMKDLYLSPFMTKKMVCFVEESPLMKKLYLNVLKDFRPTKLTLDFPDVTTRYLQKIYQLCEAEGVTMHFMSLPLADSKERREVEAVLKEKYEASVMYELFPDYYENYIYYPAEWFPDGIHPNVERSMKNEMVKKIREVNDLDWDLRLE